MKMTIKLPPTRPRRNPKPYFQAGQRIVCVDASPNRLASNRKLLVVGRIYIIRAIDLGHWKFPCWGVHLEGLRHFYPDGSVEWAFHPGRFRPVTERPTDIAIFKKLLAAPVTASTAAARGAD
jgi:hypothetical protein